MRYSDLELLCPVGGDAIERRSENGSVVMTTLHLDGRELCTVHVLDASSSTEMRVLRGDRLVHG